MDSSPSARSLNVFVSIPPQAFLVEQIGGPTVQVHTLLNKGQSPHSFEPSPRQVVELGKADVYFRIGMPFETVIVDRIQSALQDLEVVDLTRGIERLAHSNGDHEGHDHGEGDDGHGHGNNELDPHIWLDPGIVVEQAHLIEDALCRLDLENCDSYRTRSESMRQQLTELDEEIARTLAPLKGREIFVFHPAFGYFAQAYGLEQVAIQTGGKEPSARQIQRLIERAKSADVRVIFVQPQFDKRSADVIADEIGGAVVPVDPLAGDYLNNLRTIADEVRKALESSDADRRVTP